MTTIVYCKGILAADTLAVVGASTTYLVETAKIHMSSCKRFAWGTSGAVIDPDYLPEFERLMFAHLMDVSGKDPKRVEMPKDLAELILKRDFIVMCKDIVYARADKDKGTMAKVLAGEHVAIGTGRERANVAMMAGLGAQDAVMHAMSTDFFTYPGDITVIKQSSLKAMPKEIKG